MRCRNVVRNDPRIFRAKILNRTLRPRAVPAIANVFPWQDCESTPLQWPRESRIAQQDHRPGLEIWRYSAGFNAIVHKA
jgi:hypothetical protein